MSGADEHLPSSSSCRRKSPTMVNGAVEQIMRNMVKDLHHGHDGQYIQFTPPPTPQDAWTSSPPPPQQQPQTPSSYVPYNQLHHHHLHHHQPQQSEYGLPYNYVSAPPTNIYSEQQQQQHHHLPTDGYIYAQDYVFTPPLSHDYNKFLAKNMHNVGEHVFLPPEPTRTPLIDNLVGNWTANTSGTYSPFGNTSATFGASNIFEQVQEMHTAHADVGKTMEAPQNGLHTPAPTTVEYEASGRQSEEVPSFQFSMRDTKKPRMVAEVKPMRPSYSDVLLKSVPASTPTTTAAASTVAAKTSKTEKALSKEKKEKKMGKQVKQVNNVLNRSNTSNEIKDLGDKSMRAQENKAGKDGGKANNLTRKWASLDNVADGLNNEFKHDLQEMKRKPKLPEVKNANGYKEANGNNSNRNLPKKVVKNEANDNEAANSRNESTPGGSGNNKTAGRNRVTKYPGKQPKNHENNFGNDGRPPGKRSQRVRKKETNVPFGCFGQKVLEYLSWWRYIVKFFMWLFHLVSDILSLSIHLSRDAGTNFYTWLSINSVIFMESTIAIIKRVRVLTWIYERFRKEPERKPPLPAAGLHNNINMPTTGEEAMKRLLACKGKDPYSILGVTPLCTDADIKNYYKKQAKLVHPDKNQQPGAEEAFKILVHAFNMIGEPERRAAYDRGVAESAQAEAAMTELTELLVQLQQKVEAAANTIRCSACGARHKRVKVERPIYAARNCATCKIHHSAREGDIWAEARCFGFLWYYFACMDGGVYDITEWAACQKDSLKHLKPDSHNVQYRIALGKQAAAGGSGGGGGGGRKSGGMSFPRTNDRNADLNNFINNLYGQTAAAAAAAAASGGSGGGADANGGGNGSTQANQRRKAKKTK